MEFIVGNGGTELQAPSEEEKKSLFYYADFGFMTLERQEGGVFPSWLLSVRDRYGEIVKQYYLIQESNQKTKLTPLKSTLNTQ